MARAGGVLRRGSDRIIAGVCSGLSHYFGVDPIVIRLLFVLLTIFHGIGVLLYIALWVLMEPPAGATEANPTLSQRLRTMGEEIRDDVRSGFGRSQPVGPPQSSGNSGGEPAASSPPLSQPNPHRGLWFGAILVVLGAYLLLNNLGLFNSFDWGVFWPIVIILIGVFFVLRRR